MKIVTERSRRLEKIRKVYDEGMGVESHEAWRRTRLLPDGTYEPRMKPDGLGGMVDIANTGYADLPVSRMDMSFESVRVAAEYLLARPNAGDDEVGAAVHDAWIESNREEVLARGTEMWQLDPYAELPRFEQLKDVKYVLLARRVIEATEARNLGVTR